MTGNIHRKTPAKMFFSKLELFKLAKKNTIEFVSIWFLQFMTDQKFFRTPTTSIFKKCILFSISVEISKNTEWLLTKKVTHKVTVIKETILR